MMPIATENDFTHKAGRSGALISASAEIWRRLAFYLVVCASFALLLFATAANAQVSEILGEFNTINGGTIDIDKKPIVQTRCRQVGAETREQMGWFLENSERKQVASDWTPNASYLEPLTSPLDLGAFTVPGESYTLVSYCTAHHVLWEDSDRAYRKFTVNQLSGTANISAKGTNITVTGVVGNGANRVAVYRDGKQIAEKKDLTSGYSITFPTATGNHPFKVYAYYDEKHWKEIGSAEIDVQLPPDIIVNAPAQFTNKPSITISGRATSAVGVKYLPYRTKKVDDTSVGHGSVGIKWGKDVSFEKTFTLNYDGKYEFLFQAKSEDDQWATGIVYATLDRKAPDITITNRPKGDMIGGDAKIRASIRDLNMLNEDGVGAELVQVEAIDKSGKSSGWKRMSLESGTDIDGEYSIAFADIFNIHDLPEGDVRFKFRAKDKAGNDGHGPEVIYKKTSRPIATVVARRKYVTKGSWAALDIKATAKTNIAKVRLEIQVYEKGRRTHRYYEDIGSKYPGGGMNTVFFGVEGHSISTYDESTYFIRAIAESVDGQQSDPEAEQAIVIRDTRPPTVNLSLPHLEGDKFAADQEIRFKVDDEYGSGVKDVQTRICQGEENCSIWFKNIQNDGEGNYSQTLPLADFSNGPFTFKVWAQDNAGHQTWKDLQFVKQLDAADVVTTEMSFGEANGSLSTGPFYFGATRQLRLFVDTKNGTEGVTVAYSLPDGLSLAGKAKLRGSSAAVFAAAGEQVSNWAGSGNLMTDIDLGKEAGIIIDIPVKISEEPPTRLKVTKAEQTTSFEVTGKNFDGAAKAEATWKADWKKEPADVNAPITKEFDLSEPEEIILFDKVSGGYDTADLAKWNRNTLHCTSGNAECKRNFNSSDIKLRFTEQTTQKTVDLNLSGHRDQTLNPSNRPTRSGALDMQANPGAEAGVDAEVRFSVALPKSELARLPSGGQWSAKLVMEMQDHAGQRLAGFNSDIALTVTDKTGMSLKPPLMELLEGSHNDTNQSGGFSSNDEFVYRVTYKASRDLQGVQLQLSLPPELTLTGGQLRDGGSSAFVMPGDGRSRFLLREEMTLKRDETVIIDVPLRVGAGNTARLVSKVEALARGFDPLPSEDAVLNVQRRFDVSEGLGLTFEMIGQPDANANADANAEAVVAQQTPFKYRVVLASRKHTLEGLKLTYRLPGGMQMDGAPVFVGDIPQLAKVELNPQWDGDANVELLAADAKLPREESITIDIPLKVKEVVGDGVFVKSTVSAGAGNLTGELQKSHRVKTRERETGGGNRVKIVKSMDADAVVQPGAQIRYQIRVSNQTFKTVRNLLIRDRAPDHTTLVDASCGDLKKSECKTLTLSDEVVADGAMTYAGLCKDGGPQSDPQGSHVFWCLKGDLEPMADYTVNYSVRINGAAPAASGPITPSPSP